MNPRCDSQYNLIVEDSRLLPEASRQLCDVGFTVIPGPVTAAEAERLATAYDIAVAAADPDDVRTSSSTRVTDFVNRSEVFDELYIYPPLLAACCLVIGRPFKLSGTRLRTLDPGAPMEALHMDVEHEADGWPIVGFIVMVDAFDAANGATRFVPGSHLQPNSPGELMGDACNTHDQPIACGPAGSIIVFNGSVWHGHTANRSTRRRRSLQGHFVARDARASVDHAARMRPEVLQRISDRAKYVLALE